MSLNVVASLGSGSVTRVLIIGSELYGGTSDGRLVKWNKVDDWDILVSSGIASVDGLIYFNSKIYSLQSGGLYEFDDVSAWVTKVTGGFTFLSLGASITKIYAGDLFGKLWEWDGVSSWVGKTGNQINYSKTAIYYIGGEIICFTWGSAGPTLQKFTGSGWNEVAPPIHVVGTRHYSSLVDGKIVTGSIYSAGPDYDSYEWNGVDDWVKNGNGVSGIGGWFIQVGWAKVYDVLYSIGRASTNYDLLHVIAGNWESLEDGSQWEVETLIAFQDKLYMNSGLNLLEYIPESPPVIVATKKDKFANQGDILIGL